MKGGQNVLNLKKNSFETNNNMFDTFVINCIYRKVRLTCLLFHNAHAHTHGYNRQIWETGNLVVLPKPGLLWYVFCTCSSTWRVTSSERHFENNNELISYTRVVKYQNKPFYCTPAPMLQWLSYRLMGWFVLGSYLGTGSNPERVFKGTMGRCKANTPSSLSLTSNMVTTNY